MSTFKKFEICLDILRVVTYMHSRQPYPIIHRDIKPSNIVMSTSGRAKLVDFGLSKLFKGLPATYDSKDNLQSFVEEHTGAVGTAPYMAPELVKMEMYDVSIDVWSCGIIFKKLLPTKYRPYIDEHLLAVDPAQRKKASEILHDFEKFQDYESRVSFWCIL